MAGKKNSKKTTPKAGTVAHTMSAVVKRRKAQCKARGGTWDSKTNRCK